MGIAINHDAKVGHPAQYQIIQTNHSVVNMPHRRIYRQNFVFSANNDTCRYVAKQSMQTFAQPINPIIPGKQKRFAPIHYFCAWNCQSITGFFGGLSDFHYL